MTKTREWLKQNSGWFVQKGEKKEKEKEREAEREAEKNLTSSVEKMYREYRAEQDRRINAESQMIHKTTTTTMPPWSGGGGTGGVTGAVGQVGSTEAGTPQLSPLGRLQARFENLLRFTHMHAHIVGDKAYVFIVHNNAGVLLEDDRNMYPSDSLVSKIRLLME